MQLKNLTEFKALEGQDLPVSDWLTVTQAMVQHFADATLDFQWIHVDVERAKRESPFGGTIAHGFMSVSLLSKMVEQLMQIESVKMGVNYGLNKVRFPNPVRVGSRLRLHSNLAKVEDFPNQGIKIFLNCSVEIEGEEKPACIAEWISLLFE